MKALFALLALAATTIVASAAQVGQPAPAWHLTALDGHEVSSDQLKGKVVVLDFWATWCGPCKQEIPGYIALQKKYGDQGLVVIGVSMDGGGPAGVKQFVRTNDVNYTVGMSNDQIYAAFNSPDAIPTTFLIGRDGVVRDVKIGGQPAAVYEKKVVAALR